MTNNAKVLLAPWGRVETAHGPFTIDDASARSIVAAFNEDGTDGLIDYDHATLAGRFAPAAGWIKSLEAVPGVGIVAVVEWTEPALQKLADKAYRFISPVLHLRQSDRRAMALHSAALTNSPAIRNMPTIPPAAGGSMLLACSTMPLARAMAADKGFVESLPKRARIIVQAEREYEALPPYMATFTFRDWADVRLADQGEPPMTDAEWSDFTPEDERTKTMTPIERAKDYLGINSQRDFQPETARMIAEAALLCARTERLLPRTADGSGQRESIINKADAQYNSMSESGRRLCSHTAWINEGLRENKLPPLDQGEQDRLAGIAVTHTNTAAMIGTSAGAARDAGINKAATEWDRSSAVQKVASRAQFINGSLHDAGLRMLTQDETGIVDRKPQRTGRSPGAWSLPNDPGVPLAARQD